MMQQMDYTWDPHQQLEYFKLVIWDWHFGGKMEKCSACEKVKKKIDAANGLGFACIWGGPKSGPFQIPVWSFLKRGAHTFTYTLDLSKLL